MTNNLSTRLYQSLVQPDTTRALLAGFFRDDRGQALALLQSNGVNLPASATAKQIQLAWLKAIKDSATFRDQAATLLTSYIMSITGQNGSSNFVGNTDVVRYYNDITDIGSIDPSSFSSSALAGSSDTSDTSDSTDTTISAPLLSPLSSVGLASTGDQSTGLGGGISSNPNAIAASVPAPASSGGGSFWSSLGSIFTPKVLQQGITTGLQAYSTSLTASANQSSEKNALALEQMQLAQAQQNAQAQQAGSGQTMLLVVGAGVVVIGLVVVLLLFKGKK